MGLVRAAFVREPIHTARLLIKHAWQLWEERHTRIIETDMTTHDTEAAA